MYLYMNNLRELPNFGCRTTGNALGELLRINNKIVEYDALESVEGKGAWDAYARGSLKDGGIVPRGLYDKFWKYRTRMPLFFNKIEKIDKFFGGRHDYIANSPISSVQIYREFAVSNPRISGLEKSISESDGVIINGEGTLILGNPTLRDALYLLFVIALAKELQAPVYLLNAMIAPCPYNGSDENILNAARELFAYCRIIAVRDMDSHAFLSSLIETKNVIFIPDALFTWGTKIKSCLKAVRAEPRLFVSHPDNLKYTNLPLDRPYICISGSSSAWRSGDKIYAQYSKLISALQSTGYPVLCVETCDGDYFLEQASAECDAFFIPKSTPVMAAAGIIVGSEIYVTGRYHPAIMASSTGVPCIFLRSNSHKTTSIQALLGYDRIFEYPVCPSDAVVLDIMHDVRYLISEGEVLRNKIITHFGKCSKGAYMFSHIISDVNKGNINRLFS